MTKPFHLAVIEIGVALLTVQAFLINRMAGLDYPLWEPRAGEKTSAKHDQG